MDLPLYIMHGAIENILGQFHPVLVHFPIVLFTLTLICDILYYLGKDPGHKLAAILLWAGTLMCLPTVVTGWEASESFPEGDPRVIEHMTWAFTLASYALIYSIFRAFAWRKQWNIYPFVYLALSVLLVTLTSWTSDLGGILSHGTTPFSTIKELMQ